MILDLKTDNGVDDADDDEVEQMRRRGKAEDTSHMTLFSAWELEDHRRWRLRMASLFSDILNIVAVKVFRTITHNIACAMLIRVYTLIMEYPSAWCENKTCLKNFYRQ